MLKYNKKVNFLNANSCLSSSMWLIKNFNNQIFFDKNFGLGSKLLENYQEEKLGLVPNTKWKLKNIGRGWVLGETLIAGIGQGYFQTTPMQICLMTAQLANGGYMIKPTIIYDQHSSVLKKLYRNPENVKFVNDALYAATNEPMGTSYRSRLVKSKYTYAGKTGTSQIRRITQEERELKIKNEDLPYKLRDHALFTAFAPYKNPRYAITVVIEHGGSGSSGAAPIAKKLIKKVLDRHELRKRYQQTFFQEI